MSDGIRAWITPGRAIFFGAFLNAVGFVWWEGPGSSESLWEYVAAAGNLVRRDLLVTLLSIPGYLLFFGGVAVLLRRRRQTSRLLGYLGGGLIAIACIAAVLDVLRVIVTLIAIGTRDLDSPTVTFAVSDWLVDTWYPLLLRGLNAFALGVAVSLVGLSVVAAHDARLASTAEASNKPRRLRITPTAATLLGLLLYVLGLSLSSFGSGRRESLVAYIATAGNLVRRDVLVTALLNVPGYVLFFGGIAVLLRMRRRPSRLLVALTWGIIATMSANAVVDAMWVAVTLIATGTGDLDSTAFVLTAPDWLSDASTWLFNVSGIATTTALGLALLALLVNALQEPEGVLLPG